MQYVSKHNILLTDNIVSFEQLGTFLSLSTYSVRYFLSEWLFISYPASPLQLCSLDEKVEVEVHRTVYSL